MNPSGALLSGFMLKLRSTALCPGPGANTWPPKTSSPSALASACRFVSMAYIGMQLWAAVAAAAHKSGLERNLVREFVL
jgi:hypothetical protein